PGRYIGKIRHPQLIGPVGLELAIDVVQRARGRSVGDSGAHRLAPSDTMDTKTSHQSLDRAACYRLSLAVKLTPDLVSTINLHVLLPNPVNLGHQKGITLGAVAEQFWIALLCGITSIA